MKRSVLLMSIIIVGLFMIPLAANSAEKVYKLKLQSAYPRGDVSMELVSTLADYADKKSNGRIKITVFATPELVPDDQLFSATQRGTLHMFQAVGAQWGGMISVGPMEMGLPFAWNCAGSTDVGKNADMIKKFFFESGFADILRKEYAKHDLYWLDMHSYGPLFCLSTKSIKTTDDIKGKKIRTHGAWQILYDSLGALGTNIAGGEGYMGLKMGVIDMAQWDVSALTALNWYEVAPYWIAAGHNDVVAGHFVVNLKTWNSLPDDLKKILKDASEHYYHSLNKVYADEMNKVETLIKEGKVIKVVPDDGLMKAFMDAAEMTWDKTAKRDQQSAKAVKLLKEWRKTME